MAVLQWLNYTPYHSERTNQKWGDRAAQMGLVGYTNPLHDVLDYAGEPRNRHVSSPHDSRPPLSP